MTQRSPRIGKYDPPLKAIRRWAREWRSGKPHFIVGEPAEPYLRRWYILPRNRYFNVYLHQFLRDDDDRALHDHQWRFVSVMLRGSYEEEVPGGLDHHPMIARTAPSVAIRPATHAHRVVLVKDRAGNPLPCWTLLFTGPVVREWGFHCPKGWRQWTVFLDKGGYDGNNNSRTGRGCA